MCERQQLQTFLGKRDIVGITLEKLNAQFILQLLNLLGESVLCETKLAFAASEKLSNSAALIK